MEMADTPEKERFSQHASVFAILADVLPHAMERNVMEHTLTDTSLSQATYYFRFYLTRAMVEAGSGDEYYNQLIPWRNMLKLGLTTFAETPEPTRSDCHAWSASPIYEFLATICGVQPAEPGFKKVVIIPHLGPLRHVKGMIPHPFGEITVDLRRNGESGLIATIKLPQHVDGYLIWNTKQVHLHGGSQQINAP
jgi:hypothetical protein